ncbi:DNA replication and repair protein RecF [Coraliomargarita algicola]|uniref:DNA replication and repair protein RecF n=1 Tax=Coraliomargarita algicola TaxID=3092156 RepID=A0ABZ0RG85_9BACT|nr:DNA replication and repair protein RecF [Coraliomargarita sp. J2-16]WPJ93952.1 DNA replication and repair protein RecF [Coraliomargarita sp. J2-16]
MRFLKLRLQNFRNIEFTELPLEGDRNFLLGANGQGKSNLLEALGLATALRSFRTQTMAALPRKGFKEYSLAYQLEHEREGRTELEIHLGRGGRRVLIDGEKVTRLVEFIGRFPTVTLCSGDLMLLRGGPAERRRFMDLTLAVVNRAYYTALRDFHRGIAERNRLLKRGGRSAELSAFEAEIAPHASVIAKYREQGMALLREVLCQVYDQIAEADEGPELDFRPNVDCRDAEAYRKLLYESRQRDQILGATQRGPHRDDFHLALHVGGARVCLGWATARSLCGLAYCSGQFLPAAVGPRSCVIGRRCTGRVRSRSSKRLLASVSRRHSSDCHGHRIACRAGAVVDLFGGGRAGDYVC